MVLIIMHCVPSLLQAEFKYQVDFTSRYIWRGFDLNPDRQPALQPSFEYSCGDCGFTLNFWSSFSLNNKDYNEIDLNFTYDFRISEKFSLKAGFIFYGWYFVEHFSFKENTSQEVFISGGFPLLFFKPRLTVFYDFGAGDGFYILFDSQYNRRLSKSSQLSLSASLGYNGGQWLAGGADPGFSDFNLGVSVLFKSGRFGLSPFARYTVVLLDAIGKESHMFFGFSVVYK